MSYLHGQAACITPDRVQYRCGTAADAAVAGQEKLPLVKLIDNFNASWDYVANDGQDFTFRTNLNAPRYR